MTVPDQRRFQTCGCPSPPSPVRQSRGPINAASFSQTFCATDRQKHNRTFPAKIARRIGQGLPGTISIMSCGHGQSTASGSRRQRLFAKIWRLDAKINGVRAPSPGQKSDARRILPSRVPDVARRLGAIGGNQRRPDLPPADFGEPTAGIGVLSCAVGPRRASF